VARNDGQKLGQIDFRRDEGPDDFMDAIEGSRAKYFINGGRSMTTIKRKASLLLPVTALILSACGNDPNAANEANFEAALNAHYAKMKQCVPIGGEPNDAGVIQEFRAGGRVQDKQLPFFNGLAGLGLLETVSYQKDERNFSGEVKGQVDWIGFKFTDAGKTYLRPAELDKGVFSTGTPQFCYGTPQVVAITNFTEPAEVMGEKAATVQYTYKLVDVAPWANSPVVQFRYKWMPERLSSQSIEKDDDLVLTNNGWVHHSEFKQ
jgi:hypothetical protein